MNVNTYVTELSTTLSQCLGDINWRLNLMVWAQRKDRRLLLAAESLRSTFIGGFWNHLKPRLLPYVTIGRVRWEPFLPGVFLCPVMTASPVTGCSQVVLLASSLLGKKRVENEHANNTDIIKRVETKPIHFHAMYPGNIYLMKNILPSRVTP